MNYLNKKCIADMEIRNKAVFLRCDFNVPIDATGHITDTDRIEKSLDTIKYLIQNKAKTIICSHLGRPSGTVNKKYSLEPVAKYLSTRLNQNITLIDDLTGDNAHNVIKSLKPGDVCLLENIRFDERECKNDPNFAKLLASLAEVYVNDAFGTCHRAHASTEGIAHYLPSCYGFLVKKEIEILTELLETPKRPFIGIIGGSKVSDKIGIINSLLDRINILIIGGAMSYTFTNALGYSVGTSLCETDKISVAKDIMAKAKEKGVKLFLPVDNKVGKEFNPNTEWKIVSSDKIPDGWMGLDIGPKTIELFSQAVSKAGAIIWNGPMGVFEWDNFSEGTLKLAEAIATSNAISVIGGGDSAAAAKKLGFADRFTHISTGGGAALEFLEGKNLPGLDILDDK